MWKTIWEYSTFVIYSFDFVLAVSNLKLTESDGHICVTL